MKVKKKKVWSLKRQYADLSEEFQRYNSRYTYRMRGINRFKKCNILNQPEGADLNKVNGLAKLIVSKLSFTRSTNS